jgi:hypothetical protein
VLDYDDALAISTRAGLPLPEFLDRARDHGATHVSLPEHSLDRLMREGRIAVAPVAQSDHGNGAGRTCLASAEPHLLNHLADEFAARLPSSCAEITNYQLPISNLQSPISYPQSILSLRGYLPTLAEMGLGFEAEAAAVIVDSGLGVVPRPVSFAWPEDHLVERTLAQAAGLGAEIVAFDGDLILGHEMHLDTTVECLERFDLAFAYFSETRHQKGDWFIAKRRAGHGKVILAHYFTPQAMVPEDFHSAAHHWGMLARSRGIRLCYVNAFRRIHATEPLETLHYLEHVKEELEGLGLRLGTEGNKGNNGKGRRQEALIPPDRQTMALAGLASAGAASLAVSETLRLPEPLAAGLALASAAGAAALPHLDRPRGHLEEAYPPSYAPKLLALAGAVAAPIAASSFGENAASAVLAGAGIQAGVGASLAALTTGQEYQQRIEEFRSLNADLFLPLAAALFRNVSDSRLRVLALAALGAAWYASNRLAPDLLGRLDLDLPAGHTHHLSAAQRLIGDTLIALGPRPGRKWSGLGPVAGTLAALNGASSSGLGARLALSAAAAFGNAAMLAGLRRPERPLAETWPLIARSCGFGTLAGLGVAALVGALRRASNRVDHE